MTDTTTEGQVEQRSWQPPGPPDPTYAHRGAPWKFTPDEPMVPARRSVSELVSALDKGPQVEITGWRRWLHIGPSAADLRKADNAKWLRTVFPRPVSIVVATPKGGAGKTPTAIGVAAAFGLARGGDVVAWDNNELRGTLADRSFVSHRNTVDDLLAKRDYLMRPECRLADVHGMLNYQQTGQFWVLGSSQEAGHQITQEDFTATSEILSRFFPIMIIDTGNNEIAANWLEAVHNADVVLVPVKWRKDNILAAGRMLETLAANGRDIVNRCVIVGTNGPGESRAEIQKSVSDWFAPAPIVEIPTDAHISEGAEMDWSRLQPSTQRAYQSLGATAAQVIADFLRRSEK